MKKNVLFLFLLFPSFLIGQKFAVIGDFRGGDTNAYNVSQLVKSWSPEFIVTTGDNFWYGQGTIDFQIGQFYHEFIFPYQGTYGLGDTVNRFFPALGNHDLELTSLTDYQNYFVLPGNERYYDFVKGDVHCFILNSDPTEVDGNTDTSIQANWLQTALSNSVSRYKLVFLHHPPYSSGYHGCNSFSQWPFKQWGASAVLCGHDHNYERLIVDSLPYFIVGASGSPLYSVYTNYPGSQSFYCLDFGAMLAEANSDSLLLRYYNIHDSLKDSFTIYSTSSGIKPVDWINTKQKIQVFPNPIMAQTTIRYFLSVDCKATISVYNSTGNRIKVLSAEKQKKGFHDLIWNTEELPEGIYSIELKANGEKVTINLVKIERK